MGSHFMTTYTEEWRARQRTATSLSTWGPNGKRRFSVCWLIRPSYLWSVIGSGGLWPLCPQLVDNFLRLQMSFAYSHTSLTVVFQGLRCWDLLPGPRSLFGSVVYAHLFVLTIPLATFISLKLNWRMGRLISDNTDPREMGSQGEAIP